VTSNKRELGKGLACDMNSRLTQIKICGNLREIFFPGKNLYISRINPKYSVSIH
jgi:hypothetical protein